VDGIDLNCGCPQNIAKKGNYGAFLLEQPEVLLGLVRELSRVLTVPLSVKVRILLDGVEESLQFYKQLEQAGASMITIHGRTRLQKGLNTGRADWECIRRAVQLLDIPVLANGSMRNLDDVRECIQYTGAAGVMVSEALLEYPALFTETNVKSTNYMRVGPGRLQLAQEYLDLARQYPPEKGGQGRGVRCLRMHLHRILHADLQQHTKIRTDVVDAQTVEDLQKAVDEIRNIHVETNHNVAEEQLSWYVRHTTKHLENEFKMEQERARRQNAPVVDDDEEEDDIPTPAECMTCVFGEDDDDGDY
jgi:tRNA-dihydrouridine synthase